MHLQFIINGIFRVFFFCFTNVLFFVFPDDQTHVKYCSVKLTPEKYQAFVYAVKNHYWYQMYIDDLPIWGRLQFNHSIFLFQLNCYSLIEFVLPFARPCVTEIAITKP